MEYTFTENWFSSDGLELLKNEENLEFHILEIGSFEGMSTLWFLDNLLQNPKSTITCVDPWANFSQDSDTFNSYMKEDIEWNLKERKTKDKFLYNIFKNGNSEKVIIKQGLSNYVLPGLILENKQYDLIFIDGNHTAPYVMTDAIMSWFLLKKDGILVFDDYLWGMDYKSQTLRPKESVDFFISSFNDYIEVIHSDYRKILKRVK